MERLELKNIEDIVALERKTRGERSFTDKLADGVISLASRPVFIVVHLIWFGVWIRFNTGRPNPFDPFPFNFLTMTVSLEAIVLTGFVLMSQNRMTQQADRRAHLDLQINLLAEQELTAILKMQALLAKHAGIDVSDSAPGFEELVHQTDVRELASTLNSELESVRSPHASKAPNATPSH